MEIFCDGLCEPNNPGGYACWGFVAMEQGTEVHTAYGTIGHGPSMTNNLAEYTGVIEALKWAYKAGQRGFTVKTDSQLVVKQTSEEWACNKPHLQELRGRVQAGLRACDATLLWVPREENSRADALTRKAYAEATGQPQGPDAAPYVAAVQALDAMEQEVKPGFETEFLESTMARIAQYGNRTKLSDKQKVCIRRMVSEYLGDERFAELLGQQPLFPAKG